MNIHSHDGLLIVLGTLVAVGLIVAVGYLFLTRPAAKSVTTTNEDGTDSGDSHDDVGLTILGGALSGVGGALTGR